MKDENMTIDRTPGHDEDERTIQGIVPPVPPQAESVGGERDVSVIEIVDGKGDIGGHLQKTDDYQCDCQMMMCREILALPVKMEEDKN